MSRPLPVPDQAGDRPADAIEVFSPEAIERLRQREEPPTAGEAELGGPWRVRRIEGGFGLFRDGDAEYGMEPVVRVRDRSLASLAAAALPGLGRSSVFRILPEAGPEGGYPILRQGAAVGSARYFLADLCTVLDVLNALVATPSALACLLEAAGPTALERAGRELGLRISNQDPEKPER